MEGPEGGELAQATGINDEHVAQSAPLVRALAVQRLELMWRACQPHIEPDQERLELGVKPDPRFIEAGIRITDRLIGLYQLLKPQHAMSEPDPANRVDQRDLVRAQVAALEEKVRGRQEPGGGGGSG